MTYEISYVDGLYCVYKNERLGMRIIAAYESKNEAEEAIKEFRKEDLI